MLIVQATPIPMYMLFSWFSNNTLSLISTLKLPCYLQVLGSQFPCFIHKFPCYLRGSDSPLFLISMLFTGSVRQISMLFSCFIKTFPCYLLGSDSPPFLISKLFTGLGQQISMLFPRFIQKFPCYLQGSVSPYFSFPCYLQVLCSKFPCYFHVLFKNSMLFAGF